MLNLDFNNKHHLYQILVAITGMVFIVIGCLIVLAPFFPAILLASIFALSGWPAFEWLKARLHYKTHWAALAMTILLATFFIAPLVIIGTSSSENFGKAITAVQDTLSRGDLSQGSALLSHVPLAGDQLANGWTNLTSDKVRMREMVQEYAGPTSQWLIKIGASIGRGLFDLTLGIIIAYFFFRHGHHVAVRLRNLSDKYTGERGMHLLSITKNTLIGVVYGILGTALAQGAIAAFGFWLADVPGASFLGLLTFFLSFIPIGPPLVWGPAVYWLYTQGQTGWAIFLLVWGVLIISAVDNILKPYFISRGSNLPFMLVLFGIGGGAIAFGFIGIFIGPVILALAYSIVLELSTTKFVEPPLAVAELERDTPSI